MPAHVSTCLVAKKQNSFKWNPLNGGTPKITDGFKRRRYKMDEFFSRKKLLGSLTRFLDYVEHVTFRNGRFVK